MKHLNLKKVALASGLVLASLGSQAQVYTPLAFEANAGTNNHYKDYVGIRFTISNPAIDAAFTISNDGSGGAGEWGGAVTGTLTGNLVKADDIEACSALVNGSAISGNIAVINRGNCEFGEKALNAETAGAIAVVIINNVAGQGPVGMGAGSQGANVTIPVFMISKEDGDALLAVLNQSQTSTATVIPWSAGTGDEIAIIKGGAAPWHTYAIPWHQLGTGNGNPDAYKMQYGAYVANFGANNQTNVSLTGIINWTPEGSTTTTQVDSTVANNPGFTFAPTDSIRALYISSNPDLHASGPGRFDIIHRISSDADGAANNNTVTQPVYVTSNVFSKARYDFANNRPISNMGYGSTGTTPVLWGPMYYSANAGGYTVDQLQFSISTGTPGPMGHAQFLYLLKWVDGSNGGTVDGVMQSMEVSVAGLGDKQFNGTSSDSSGKFYSVNLTDNTQQPVMLEANTWYWAVAEVPESMFLGCDGQLNYLPRSVLYNVNTNDAQYEQYGPIYFEGQGVFEINLTDYVNPFPFEGTADIDSLRFAHQKQGMVPAIAMITSQFPASVPNTAVKAIGTMNLYPNPATDKVTVEVELEKKAEKVTYTVISVLGQFISREEHTNVQNDKLEINTSALAAGKYCVVVTTGEKSIFEHFVVVGK